MRFGHVTAVSFGPFRGEQLQLAPGFTIVHGPNESGKTTWAAALYATVAGRRRSRGRGTRDEAQFRARHKPWSGSRWQVAAAITTDDGTELTITQDLVGGTTLIRPTGASRPFSRQELERRFGLAITAWDDIDVAELFGLSRGTLRATTFVPQAEILRVLDQADELQQYLQRAASSLTVDVTAHEVLEKLRSELAERVGSLSLGRRPLRRATEELRDAEEAAYQLRAARDELRRTATQVAGLAGDEARARNALAQAQSWLSWADVDALQAKLDKVRQYDMELAALATLAKPAAPEVVQKAREARSAYLMLDALPEAPAGASVLDLQGELARLPGLPVGDTSPEPQVRALWENLTRATTALTSRAELSSEDAALQPAIPDATSDELRRSANELRLRRPVWDPQEDETEARLREEHTAALEGFERDTRAWQARATAYEQAQSEYAAARNRYAAEHVAFEEEVNRYRLQMEQSATRAGGSYQRSGTQPLPWPQWLLYLGGILLAVGIVGVMLDTDIGFAVAGVGLVMVLAAVLFRVVGRRGRPESDAPTADDLAAPAPPHPPHAPSVDHPGGQPLKPVLSDQAQAIAVRREQWRRSAEAYDDARISLLERLVARGVPTDPDELDRLAQQIDQREGARKLAEEQRADLARLEHEVRDAAQRLVDALRVKGEEGPGLDAGEAAEADALYRRYEAACAHRAELASAASRRDDLERALEARASADEAYRAAVERRAARVADVLAAAQLVGGAPGDNAQTAADLIGGWLQAQDRAVAARQELERISSLREQLLNGARPDELAARVSTVSSALGARPESLPPNPEELVASASSRVEECATLRATAEGHLEALRQKEGDLPAAIEAAAAGKREVDALVELKATLELAIEHLEAAQQQAHRSITPVLESAIRRRLPLVMDGRYQDVRVTAETLAVELQERSGAWRDAALLSQGTTEQTFLLLRLALVEHLGTQETMPLILDDVTVQCDAMRTTALLSLLHDISKERQVILFSQETAVRDWATQHLNSANRDLLIELPGTAVASH